MHMHGDLLDFNQTFLEAIIISRASPELALTKFASKILSAKSNEKFAIAKWQWRRNGAPEAAPPYSIGY